MKSVKLDGIAETRDLNPRMRMTQQMTHLLVSVCLPHGQNDSHAAHMSHGNNHTHHLTSGRGEDGQLFESSFRSDLLFWH